MKPEELLYAKSHEWAYVQAQDGDKIATVGISAFAIEQLTDLVFLELPEVGKQVSAGDALGEIESVKAVSDVYSPVSGEILAVNEGLPDDLGKLNDDPYNLGWLAKIKLSDTAPLDKLMDYAAYQKQCAEEG